MPPKSQNRLPQVVVLPRHLTRTLPSPLPVERSVVAYGRDHDDAVGCDLPDLVDERLVGEVRAADAQVQDVHLLQDGVVERVQKPRGERRLPGGGGGGGRAGVLHAR